MPQSQTPITRASLIINLDYISKESHQLGLVAKMGITEKIDEIVKEMARTQKNKATEGHLGSLKAKLARYRAELLEPAKTGKAGDGFDVSKAGYGRVALIGFPSVGKSTLLSKLTGTQSEAASYEFTTLVAIPGVLNIDGAKVQLLDLPGIVEGAASGKGRGRQVIAAAKSADLVLMMLDATKAANQRRLLEIELEAVGMRLNRKKPDVIVRIKAAGGVTITHTVPLTRTDERAIKGVMSAYKLHNADIMIREDITTDDLIDVILGTRKYVPCLYCYNKIDAVSLEEVDRIAREPNTVVISCELDLNLDTLLKRIWELIGLNRVYTKKRGALPDLGDPLIVKMDADIEGVCNAIHKNIASKFKYALVWGKSSKFAPKPQRVGLTHRIAPDDVVSLVTNV
ncbi:developmentally-regulated GTP-binding protein 2 [Microbotryum lychnidis-dioicae p1A1 Lamole]|uniref:Developmentally-regulated GTP-binding protein 2 n=1 Tax=Microbotryum lychnidis-dioicae (strain p1A1 Lamole / MvSl-1064) TaxID=683840 RepID=U5HED7_USTV1|nr:developmentally-regulated GTP-binding protein 2 [Microbotryum lychnidis-dioicae p1A1 Lamole]|eukprot:KDE04042.1 developmentally-regulated GTP-binding protein 2 [Microbotryum lychnidis-dioicae p1A1 Lamole]